MNEKPRAQTSDVHLFSLFSLSVFHLFLCAPVFLVARSLSFHDHLYPVPMFPSCSYVLCSYYPLSCLPLSVPKFLCSLFLHTFMLLCPYISLSLLYSYVAVFSLYSPLYQVPMPLFSFTFLSVPLHVPVFLSVPLYSLMCFSPTHPFPPLAQFHVHNVPQKNSL